jgi:hypothetical protein
MHVRDRIRELRRVKAAELRPHPRNWRTHPPAQQDALRGVLAEIGYAGALLARELADGSLELIDGHLRAETTPEMDVPVLVVDLTDEEAAKLLAVHDPLAALAEADPRALSDLLRNVHTSNAAVQALLDDLAADAVDKAPKAPPEAAVPELFQVVVECDDEAAQRYVYERLTQEGYRCRLLVL